MADEGWVKTKCALRTAENEGASDGGRNREVGRQHSSQTVSFYVDKECILCSVCSDAAPNNFRMSDDEDHDICYKQPADEEELAQCYEALENCPVEAIGDDG